MCSTPFGIIGIFTVPGEYIRFSFFTSAQRLSASLESSPARLRLRRDIGLVLNAFRHHWHLQTRPRLLLPRSGGAQRLSASLESSLALGEPLLEPLSVLN